jgi:hypothetical protein
MYTKRQHMSKLEERTPKPPSTTTKAKGMCNQVCDTQQAIASAGPPGSDQRPCKNEQQC